MTPERLRELFYLADPLNYAAREELKALGRELCASSSQPLPVRALGLLAWIKGHYWRAKEALEGSPKSFQRRVLGKRWAPGIEIEFDWYVRHWLDANGMRVREQDVVQCLQDEFGYTPEKSPYLPPGATYYRE